MWKSIQKLLLLPRLTRGRVVSLGYISQAHAVCHCMLYSYVWDLSGACALADDAAVVSELRTIQGVHDAIFERTKYAAPAVYSNFYSNSFIK